MMEWCRGHPCLWADSLDNAKLVMEGSGFTVTCSPWSTAWSQLRSNGKSEAISQWTYLSAEGDTGPLGKSRAQCSDSPKGLVKSSTERPYLPQTSRVILDLLSQVAQVIEKFAQQAGPVTEALLILGSHSKLAVYWITH